MRRLAPLVFSLALLGPTAASAVDLDTHLEAWTLLLDGGGATDDADRADAIAITATDHLVVGGQLDGAAAADGHDAVLFELDTAGNTLWTETTGSGPADAWFDVVVDPLTDDVALCGAAGDPQEYVVDIRDAGVPPTGRWVYEYADGAQSPIQECRAVAFYQNDVYSAGWADSGTENGVWLTFLHDELDGHALQPPLRMDDAAFDVVPDRANGFAIDPIDGSFVVVGERGVAGGVGSDLNDSNFHVRAYDASSVELWTFDYGGSTLLLDAAEDVVIDPATGDVFVVGWTNKGTDNAGGRDRDWFLVRLLAAGDGAGGPQVVWSQPWETGSGADEVATAVVMDEAGDLLVAGSMRDGNTGLNVFAVQRFAAYDGARVDAWLGVPGVGHSLATAVDFRNGLVAVAGWEDTGAGVDLRVTLVDSDGDGDGVADAADACPTDAAKSESPGVCGCGVLDQDTDGDTVLNCEDACPANPDKFDDVGVCGCEESDEDTDADLTPDCVDDCPTDPNKADGVGECGCGSPDTDTDSDGVLGCDDACANTPPDTRVDEFGCPRGGPGTTTDTGETTGTTDGETDDKGGCGCDAGPGSVGAFGLLLAPLLLRRRRA